MELIDRVRAALGPQYEVERELGRGGMGTVFLGRDLNLRRPVAIKILHPELASARVAEAFQREARALARVSHPNVVVVHHRVEGEGLFLFVMEYVDGETVYQRLKRGPLGYREVVRLGLDLLSGLTAVHRAGIIHRDIKPGNIFLTDGRAVLGDFGVARVQQDAESPESTLDPGAGTPDYMAPEQCAGGLLSPRTDLYQVGAVLYEAISGRRWRDVEPTGRAAWSGIPRGLSRMLRRALARNAAARWVDAAQFHRVLARLQHRPMWPSLAVASIGVLIAGGVLYQVLTTPPQSALPIQPRVELTILRFTGPDSGAAHRLARFTSDPLNRFPPITTRPHPQALSYQVPTDPGGVRRMNTRYYVSGEIGDRLLTLSVYDSIGRPVRDVRVPAPRGDLLAWGREAADSLVGRLFRPLHARYRALSGQGGSDDAEAVNLFLLGEEEHHRGEYVAAEQYFRRALDLDPAFSICAWYLTLERKSLRTLTAEALTDLTRLHGDKLPEPYHSLLGAELERDLQRRLAHFREVIRLHPQSSAVAWYYGEELFHRGPLAGVPLDSALGQMQVAARLDPSRQQAPADEYAIWAAIRQGRQTDARQALRSRARVAEEAGSPEGIDRVKFFQLAYYERFDPWKARLLRRWLYRKPDSLLLRQTSEVIRLGLAFDIPESKRALGEILVRQALGDSMRALGHESQGLGLMLLGRPSAARPHFDSAASAYGTLTAAVEREQWRLFPGALGVPGTDSAQMRAARRRLEALSVEPGVRSRAIWTLAGDAILRGDREAALPWIARMATIQTDSGAGRLLRLLQVLDEGHRALPESALVHSTPLLGLEPETVADPFARSVLYLSRARWQEQLGQLDAAERTLLWQESSDFEGMAKGEAQPVDVDGALSGLTRLRRGRVLLELGRRDEGCPLLRRVRELWNGAEPVFTPMRQELDSRMVECEA